MEDREVQALVLEAVFTVDTADLEDSEGTAQDLAAADSMVEAADLEAEVPADTGKLAKKNTLILQKNLARIGAPSVKRGCPKSSTCGG